MSSKSMISTNRWTFGRMRSRLSGLWLGVLCVGTAMLCVACGGNNDPSPRAGGNDGASSTLTDKTPKSGTSTPVAAQTPAPGTTTIDSGTYSPPADARYSILCQSFTGPTNVTTGRQTKALMIQSTGRKDWYLVHATDSTTLYLGYYRTFDNPNDGDFQRAQQDLRLVKDLKSGAGVPLYPSPFFVEKTTNNPPAPAEWNLVNSKGFWSLQIAAYRDNPQRKQAAVDAVRAARAEGIEAYYYHGEFISSVCIGSWPRSAVKEPAPVENSDPNKKVIVATPDVPDAVVKVTQLKNRDSGSVVVNTKYEPVSPDLIATMHKYPHHYLNGEVFQSKVSNPVTHKTEMVPDRSFLVSIPHPATPPTDAPIVQGVPNSDNGSAPIDPNAAIFGTQPAPTQGGQKQPGQLRGLGE